MTIVQFIMQVCLTLVLLLSVLCVIIALKNKGRPWQKGVSGLGGALFFLGYYLNLLRNNGHVYENGYAYDFLCLYLGVTLMVAPALWAGIAEVWHQRPRNLLRNSGSHYPDHSGD